MPPLPSLASYDASAGEGKPLASPSRSTSVLPASASMCPASTCPASAVRRGGLPTGWGFGLPPGSGWGVPTSMGGAVSGPVKQPTCRMADAAPKINGGRILGPIPAEIYQIRQWYRMRFLVSGGVNAALQGVVAAWLAKITVPRNVRLKVDVNPQSFF